MPYNAKHSNMIGHMQITKEALDSAIEHVKNYEPKPLEYSPDSERIDWGKLYEEDEELFFVAGGFSIMSGGLTTIVPESVYRRLRSGEFLEGRGDDQ